MIWRIFITLFFLIASFPAMAQTTGAASGQLGTPSPAVAPKAPTAPVKPTIPAVMKDAQVPVTPAPDNDGAEAASTPTVTDTQKIDPCAAYMSNYDYYTLCQDRQQKLQRMKDAAAKRHAAEQPAPAAETPKAPTVDEKADQKKEEKKKEKK